MLLHLSDKYLPTFNSQFKRLMFGHKVQHKCCKLYYNAAINVEKKHVSDSMKIFTAYGDILPVTLFEMLFISVIAISSKIWLGLALSDILSGVQNHTDITYHLAADGVMVRSIIKWLLTKVFAERVNQLWFPLSQKLYGELGVRRETLKKLIEYLTHNWIQNKGVIIPEFVHKAPASMKMDLYAAVYGDHFRKVSFPLYSYFNPTD